MDHKSGKDWDGKEEEEEISLEAVQACRLYSEHTM